MKIRIFTLVLMLLVSALPVTAAEDAGNTIRAAIGKILPDMPVSEITPSPLEGVSEVIIGSQLIYVSNDGKYILQGNLIELATRTNLSEERMQGIRLGILKDISKANMIVFPAAKETHVVTVFTDIDCGYCRKLHSEIGQYNEKGITVQYLMYPRSGPATPSFDKAVTVWCSENRQDALTRAKAGEELEKKTCDNPVGDHYATGQKMGVRGTPAIVLDNGALLPGYLPATKLVLELDKRS